MRIGSELHKALFCGSFLATHRTYDPAELRPRLMPALAGSALRILKLARGRRLAP